MTTSQLKFIQMSVRQQTKIIKRMPHQHMLSPFYIGTHYTQQSKFLFSKIDFML